MFATGRVATCSGLWYKAVTRFVFVVGAADLVGEGVKSGWLGANVRWITG